VFGEAYEKFKDLLTADSMVLIRGQVSMREGDKKPKLRAENIMSLTDSREKLTRSIHVRLKTSSLEESFINEIHEACSKVSGTCSLILHVVTAEDNEYRIRAKNITTAPISELLEKLRIILGKENVWLSKFAAVTTMLSVLHNMVIILWIITSAVVYGTSAIVMCSFSINAARSIERWWHKHLLFICGVTIATKGFDRIDKSQRYIFLANHQSYFDIPVLSSGLAAI